MKPFQTIAPFAASLTRASLAGVRQVGDALSSDSPKTFFRRFAVFPYSVNTVKVGVSLLAVVFLGAGASINQVLACGVPTQIPTGPFMNQSNGDFRMLYSEPWTTLRLSPKTSLEVGAIFTPVPNYSNSRVLGPDWRLSAIEATALPVSDREYEMILPSGHRERLERSKTSNQLKGRGWIATLNGRDFIAKSSCGNELRYQAGRLKVWKTPDGVEVLFNQDARGNYSVKAGKTVVLTLKPAYDTNTQKIYHLNLQGGKHAILRFGTRSILGAAIEKDSFGRNKGKRVDVLTLASIQWDGESERKYDFALNEMSISGKNNFLWELASGKLLKNNGISYQLQKISGINCQKIIQEDGTFSIQGKSVNGDIEISKSANNNAIYKTEYFLASITEGKIRKRSIIQSNGIEEVIEKYSYDEKGRVCRKFVNGLQYDYNYEPQNSSVIAKSVSNGVIEWAIYYGPDALIRRFEKGRDIYIFSEQTDLHKTEVTQLGKDGEVISKFVLDTLDVKKLFTFTTK